MLKERRHHVALTHCAGRRAAHLHGRRSALRGDVETGAAHNEEVVRLSAVAFFGVVASGTFGALAVAGGGSRWLKGRWSMRGRTAVVGRCNLTSHTGIVVDQCNVCNEKVIEASDAKTFLKMGNTLETEHTALDTAALGELFDAIEQPRCRLFASSGHTVLFGLLDSLLDGPLNGFGPASGFFGNGHGEEHA